MPLRDIPANLTNPRRNEIALSQLSSALGSVEVRVPRTMGRDANVDDLTMQALQAALQNHAQRGNSGRFTTVAIPGYGYSIVPQESRNRAGGLVSTASPLDVQIRMKEGKVRTSNAIRELCEAVSEVSGYRIDTSVGLYHSGLFDDTVVAVDGKPEVARIVGRNLEKY